MQLRVRCMWHAVAIYVCVCGKVQTHAGVQKFRFMCLCGKVQTHAGVRVCRKRR